MISSTPLKHPLPPQAIRPTAPAGQKPANTPHPVAGVRFGGSTPTPSLWERFKQGVARLWNTLISPFKSILSWFKTPEASPKASVTPGSAPSPSQNQDPSAKPTPPAASAKVQPAEARPAAPADPNRPSATPPPAALPARPKPETLPTPGSLPVSASQPSKTKKSRKSSSTEPKLESPPVKSQVTQPQGHTPQPAQPTIVAQPMDSQRPRPPQQASQPAQPVRPTTTDRPPASSSAAPGIWARATSFLAGLRPQPSAQQRHQQALNALQEMIGEPETPPTASSRQQSKKSSEPGAPTRSRPAATSSRPVAATANLLRTVPMEELFGRDLTRIQFQQSGANTCYLLSALDNIFQHPQGQKILDLIKVKKIENGFEVEFPGQSHPITVHHDELGQYVQSKTPGVAIIEKAYLKIPGAKPPDVFDSTHNALIRMFGKDRVSQPNFQETTLAASAQMQPLVDEFAELWTATRRIVETGKPPSIGEHYYSLRLHPQNPNKIDLVNPYATQRVEQTLTEAQMEESFWPEMNRIRLGN